MGLTKMNVHNAESAKALADLVKRERAEELKSARNTIMEIIEERASKGLYDVRLNNQINAFDLLTHKAWLENLGFSVSILTDIGTDIDTDIDTTERGYLIYWG